MKKSIKISLVYIGLIIGAGFASGREVMEYFNLRSNTSLCGVLTAAVILIPTLIRLQAERRCGLRIL